MPVGRTVLTGKPQIASGRRDRLVTVETKTDTVDTNGFPSDATWTPLTTLFMGRRDVTADERMAAGMDTAFATTIWHAPYVPALDPELVDVPSTKRLSYKGRAYNIRAASLLERRTGIELMTLVQVG